MGITLSDSAADRVKRFLTNRGKGVGLRLGVKTSGCSGMAYVLEFVDEVNGEDQVFDDKGVKVIIDAKSLAYLDGTELDFVHSQFPFLLRYLSSIEHLHDLKRLLG